MPLFYGGHGKDGYALKGIAVMAKKLTRRSPLQAMFDAENADRDLRDELESLCRAVSLLDDAGLPDPLPRLISRAKKLLERCYE